MRPKNTTYFELRDDALSVNCEHPRKGDIFAAIDGEGKDGELHTVLVNGTHHAGYLNRFILIHGPFKPKSFESYTLHALTPPGQGDYSSPSTPSTGAALLRPLLFSQDG